MNSNEPDDDYEYYCVDCRGSIKHEDKFCPHCGADTRQFIKEDEDEADELDTRPRLVDCPACHSAISNQAQSCPRCGQPMTHHERPAPSFRMIQSPMFSVPRKPSTGISPVLIVCLVVGALVVLGSLISSLRNSENSSVQSSALRPLASVPSTPTATPIQTNTPSEGFKTETSKQMLLRFIIKPTLLRMLNNPDSLEDLEMESITPIKRMPGAYKVTVFYRAENAFGGLVAQRQSFLVTKGTGTGVSDWMNATPVKD